LIFTSQGRLNIKNRTFAEDQGPLDPACSCMVCRRYSRAYLRHLISAGEPLFAVLATLHNLAFYLDTMQSVRDAMELGTLSELLGIIRARTLDAAAQNA
ncbi:MAG TPA: tRNA-guanine transglycosylase, partial [Acidobacteriaceae bacterium]